MSTQAHTQTPLERLRHHVSGAIARGESVPIVEVAGPAKHTPGPWDIVQDAPLNPRARFNIGSRGPGGLATYVCTIKTEKHLALDGNEEANARLIAAAPDLLEALRGLLRETRAKNPSPKVGKDFSLLVHIEGARKAIAKAEGEQ
jgi:hypothetical protein